MKEGYCGPMALEWVAQQKGLDYTQERLAEICGTTTKDGTTHEAMLAGAREMGFRAFRLQGLYIEGLAELLNHHYVIVNWMDGDNEADNGHYSRLEKVEDGIVYLNDTKMPIDEFEKKWYDIEDGEWVEKWSLIIRKV